MTLSRRQFAILVAAVAAGCERQSPKTAPTTAATLPSAPSSPTSRASEAIDAGPLSEFKSDDVYADLRDEGVIVIRRDDKLFAISSVCTHKGCKVRVAADKSFYCKCHGSTFDKDGHVTKGPATRDLPQLSVTTDEQDHLLVKRLKS